MNTGQNFHKLGNNFTRHFKKSAVYSTFNNGWFNVYLCCLFACVHRGDSKSILKFVLFTERTSGV